MRFIGKFFFIAVACLCAAAPPAPRESRAAELKSDADVEGLWLTAPTFPNGAKVVKFKADSGGDVVYDRGFESQFFSIRRSSSPRMKKAAGVKRIIEKYVEEKDGDQDVINFDVSEDGKQKEGSIGWEMSAEAFAIRLGYPCMTATYSIGESENPRRVMNLFVFTGEFVFVVEAETPWGSPGRYNDWVKDWFMNLKFVNEGEGGGGSADDKDGNGDAPDAKVEGLWLAAPAFQGDAESVEFEAKDNGEVQYTRDIGDLIFMIARSPSGVTYTPETVKKTIGEHVGKNNGDIEFDENAGAFAEILKYPSMTAKYKVDEDGEPRQGMYLFVFTDEFTFVVLWEAEPGSVGKYKDQLEGWFHNLKFVNAEPGSDESVKEKDPVAVVYTSGGFDGEAWIIDGPGGYDLGKDFDLPNDSVCSVRVKPGYKMTLCRDPGFGGECLEIDGDSDGLGKWNRVTSSLKVEKADTGGKGAADADKWLKALEEAAPGYAKLGKGGEELAKAVERNTARIEKYHSASWYGAKTDGERVKMAGELIEIFRDCGADVGDWTPNSFAQQMNNFYDWLPGSVWRTACRILNVDPDAFESTAQTNPFRSWIREFD